MRKIKFRAWVFGGLDEDSKPFMTNVMCLKWDFDQWIINWEEHDEWSNQSEYYLMQFTGLCDKNSKEIYEGDIISDKGGLWKVIFYKAGYWAKFIGGKEGIVPLDWRTETGKIIGNVFENKELLNDNKKTKKD